MGKSYMAQKKEKEIKKKKEKKKTISKDSKMVDSFISQIKR